VLLSFCIPTYNFGAFIGAALDSIARQAGDDVEVVIVDGGSDDDTAEVVSRFNGRFARLVFDRRQRRGGIDRDLSRAVSLARGEYCWLFSADDVLVDDAVARMRRALDSHQDILLCNRVKCTFNLRQLHLQWWLSTSVSSKTFYLSDASDARNYANSARSLGALLSYISAIVFRRSLWPSNAESLQCMGSHFAAAVILLGAARSGATLHYLSEPLVMCRGENDSFLAEGSFRRFRIDVDGFELVMSLFADTPSLERAYRAVFRREHPAWRLAGPFERARTTAERDDLERRLRRYGYSRVTLRLARAVASMSLVVAVGRAADRGWRSRSDR
jgi:abequosyltransferase